MAMEYTEEQLNNFDKATLVQLFLAQQSQLRDIDQRLQLLLEQVAVLNHNRFGRSSEKLQTENQTSFLEVDGNIIYFNESEAVESLAEYEENETTKPRGRKVKGKRATDIQGLPVIPVGHRMTEEELICEFRRMGLNIDRADMAHWTILCAERYLSVFYDYLHERIYDYHVLQADETPVLVSKENRTEGSKHYMWVYRTGKMYLDKQIVLYEYQPSRNASHPRAFLKDFKGVCVTDGYQAYHTIEKEREDLRIAGCWRHARRRFDEAVKALPKDRRKSSLAYLALKQIQAIYREENKLASMTIEERLKHRQLTVKPLVDAYFTWIKQNLLSVTPKSKTAKGLTYSLNQEKYLKTFLEDGEVPMDNNSAEQAIRPFCVGKKNWVMIDTIAGAEASAIIYSIAETAKSNNLKPYNYFEYLLTEIPKHMEDHDVSFCEDLLPWSDKLPAECRK
ncbi:IS66 family transposase [Roseburia hominis]|uniref:IS66 family transposase n=2 Tax=Roseburia hominis TaxID=301301 RepID=UPI003AF58BDB